MCMWVGFGEGTMVGGSHHSVVGSEAAIGHFSDWSLVRALTRCGDLATKLECETKKQLWVSTLASVQLSLHGDIIIAPARVELTQASPKLFTIVQPWHNDRVHYTHTENIALSKNKQT